MNELRIAKERAEQRLHELVEQSTRQAQELRDLQDRTGGFTAWIPWTFQKENTMLDGKVEEAGGFEYLKTLAVSRLQLSLANLFRKQDRNIKALDRR